MSSDWPLSSGRSAMFCLRVTTYEGGGMTEDAVLCGETNPASCDVGVQICSGSRSFHMATQPCPESCD